jgi:hypothetical protein
LLTPNDLKNWLHRDLARTDKVLLALGTFDQPTRVQNIKDRARDAGHTKFSSWNISQVLERTRGLAINTKSGWELTDNGRQHLRALGVSKLSPSAVQVAVSLREILQKIQDEKTRKFAGEAVRAYEFELYRSAVVMSWLAAVHVLKGHVIASHLDAFNAAALRKEPNWRLARTPDDFGAMKESAFLDRLVDISVLGKNVKGKLKECLDLRNACGHPNSFELSSNTVASHLEILILNVFEKFAK